MLKRSIVLVLGCILATTQLASPAEASSTSGSKTQNSYIVVLKDDVASPQATASGHARQYQADIGHVYDAALNGYAAELTAGKAADLKKNPQVKAVMPDRKFKTATKGPSTQILPSGANRVEADHSWSVSGDGRRSVKTAMAIIDTGSGPHPDLNVAGGVNCLDPGLYPNAEEFNDLNGHGTHVAGIAAARDNEFGVVGVAPGAPIYSVRVLDEFGSGTLSSVLCGVDWVTANAAKLRIKVANMSLTGYGADDGDCGRISGDPLHVAICGSTSAGVTYVVAAGNNGFDLSTTIPAAYREVLTVTAVTDYDGQPGGAAATACETDGADKDDTAADYSNYTTIHSPAAAHTIAAPGTCIRSTWMNGEYLSFTGTSMASPHVAGAVALCVASFQCRRMKPAQIVERLPQNAILMSLFIPGHGFSDDPFQSSTDRYYGAMAYAPTY